MAKKTSDATKSLVGEAINNRFEVGRFISGGSFGSFHLGIDQNTGAQIGIKLEHASVGQPQLHLEYGFYRALMPIDFIPTVHHFGPIGNWHALVMDLLGPSLKDMLDKMNDSRFTLITTTMLTIQFVNMFEYVHDHGILYRDVKPENFLFGLPNSDHWWRVHMIDMGFCKHYIDENNLHVPMVTNKPVCGTTRYMSVNNHDGIELSRRDDLEAILYMIVFLHKGELPWQGIPNTGQAEWTKKVGEAKKKIKPKKLFYDMPNEFMEFFQHLKNIGFDESPQYRVAIGGFRSVLDHLGTTLEEQRYDWDPAHNPVERAHPSNFDPFNTATTEEPVEIP